MYDRLPMIIRVAAVRAIVAVRFDMTAGPVLVTVAIRTAALVECAPAHIDVRGKAQWTYVRVC